MCISMKSHRSMNSSRCLPSSQHSVPSPDGRLIATVYEYRLIIRSSTKSIIVQNFALPQDVHIISSWPFLQWSRREHRTSAKPGEVQTNSHPSGLAALRILLANDMTVLLWDTDDSQWHSVVSGGCGNLKVAHVCFGYSADEIMLFSESGIRVVIWSLASNRAVAEIRDPKFPATCYGFRPRTGHLAILTRASGHDTLLLLSPKSHELVRTVNLTTVDAQGISWSPDGRWLAIWDIPSMGFKVLIHTADGHLYKTYSGGQDADNIGLGVKTLKWSPNSNFLVIGDSNQRAVLLPTSFFSPSITFEHVSRLENAYLSNVWEEQISATAITTRTYLQPSQPTCPPTTTDASQHPNNGISTIEWNPVSTLFATKNDFHPSTIWIWSPRQQHIPVGILIHHSPIKKISWHPSYPYLLLIQCHHFHLLSDPIIYLWSAHWDTPNIIKLPALDKQPAGARLEVGWLITDAVDDGGGVRGEEEEEVEEEARPLSIFVGNNVNYMTLKIGSRNGQVLAQQKKMKIKGIGPEDIFDEGTSSVIDL